MSSATRFGFIVASLVLISTTCPGFGAANSPAEEDRLPTVKEATRGLERRPGLLDIHVDQARGRVWLELPPPGDAGEIGSFLYVEGLVRGLGSNPVGLDRGQLGPTRVIRIRRTGGKVLVEQPNLSYRALDAMDDEARAVDESFARSVLWGAAVAASDPDGRSLVDFTSFIVRDAHQVESRLRAAGQGSFELDSGRSATDLDECRGFPENLEFEATLTYVGKQPGPHVREVAPTPEAVTLVQHHSILRLPEPGYRPRRFDPRAGSFSVRFKDYATPLDRPLTRRFVVRHRLQRTDPGDPSSPVREPLVYHVDRGTPEPVRGALIEGASWWSRAFEAAGFKDAFRVELLPEGVHPLDARYNVIQWVHRSTRGWSYGGGVVDPRTGEMVKGHVSLGSLRVRQDRRIFEGLLGADRTGSGGADDPIELALARLRQLSAHEVGHTLGLDHNFAASTYDGRASVMDYPAPLVRVDGSGRLDAGEAYGVGVGSWDLQTIRYAYSEFAPGVDESAELARIVRQGLAAGHLFLGDEDARPAGAAQPLANLWDNGDDPVDELERLMEVRRVALEGFGEANVAEGAPLAGLEEVLATVYLLHRFQVDAAAKVVGGLSYRHSFRGDGQPSARPVSAQQQRRAIEALLETLQPAALDIDEATLGLLLPRPPGYEPNRELFDGGTRPAFDALAAAATATGLVVDALLQRERCARLVDFHRRDRSLPGLVELLERFVEKLFDPPDGQTDRWHEVRRTTQQVLVGGLIRLSADPQATPGVRARVDSALAGLSRRFAEAATERDPAVLAHTAFLAGEIERYLARPYPGFESRLAPRSPPPGSPIGSAPFGFGGCGFDDERADAAR